MADYKDLRAQFQAILAELAKKTQPTSARVSYAVGDYVWLQPDGDSYAPGSGNALVPMRLTGNQEVGPGDIIGVHRGRSPIVGMAAFYYNEGDGTPYARMRSDYLTSPAENLLLQAGSTNLRLTDTTAIARIGGSDYDLSDIGTGTDADAIHDNVAAEISAITEKTTPVSADVLVIEDSAASYAKKRVQIGNLPGSGAPPNALKNGSFNHTTADFLGSLPPFWVAVGTTTLTCEADVPDEAIDLRLASSLQRSLKIVGDLDEGVSQTAYDNTPGQVYTLSGYVKVSAGTWKVQVSGDVTSTASDTGTDSAWTYFEVEATLNSNPTSLTVSLLAGANTTTVFFDDVMLARGRSGTRPFDLNPLDYRGQNYLQYLGGTSYYFPNMVTVSGTVAETGNPTTVTFPVVFAQAPVVTVSVSGATTPRFATIESKSASQFVVQVYDASGADQDETVEFIAVGPITTPT